MSGTVTRVLHVAHDMGVGGAEQVVRQLVSGVDATRFRSSVVCIDGRVGPIGVEMADAGVPVHVLHRRAGFDRALVLALRRMLREQRIDVLHCHQYTPYSYGVLAAAFSRVRVVFTEHGRFHPDRHSWKRRLLNPLFARLTDHIVAISAATRDALVTFEWLPRKRIGLIYNGLRPPDRVEGARPVRARLGIADDALVLGTIARLDPIKNQAMMLDALARLRERRPDCVLILAGDGPERESLERAVRDLGLDEAVFFTGFVTDIADHLDAIDVFLLTSWSEGTSMTLLEAMSLGKTIVSTGTGGTTEILEDGRSARFVDAGDVAGLVSALDRLADDADERRRLGEAARDDFDRRFRAESMVERYEALYR